MIRLSEIILRQIRSSEFDKIHGIWYKKQKDTKGMDCAVLVSCLKYFSYEELIESFRKSEYRDRIRVNKHRKWQNYYTRKMEKRHVNEIADIAKHDRFKKGHLELNFKIEYDTLDFIKLKFVELEDGIFAYEIMFPNKYHYVFTWEKEPEFEKSNTFALWMPKDQKIVIGNLTLN
jgi:hypothetical protein